jgi:hypothetical protein
MEDENSEEQGVSTRLTSWWNQVATISTDITARMSTMVSHIAASTTDDSDDASHGVCSDTSTVKEQTSTVWLLGKAYEKANVSLPAPTSKASEKTIFSSLTMPSSTAAVGTVGNVGQPSLPEELLEDFRSRIWTTYRHQFEAIKPTSYTTDVGWGCMARCGQSILAQALLFHLNGRGSVARS